MKKALASLVAVLLLLLTSCTIGNETATVKNGTYVMVQDASEEVMLPRVAVSEDRISFSYDVLSSYLPVGSYEVEGHRLKMMTDDGLHQYVFEIEGETLIFLEEESSKVKLTNEKIGTAVTDQTVFQLQEK